MTLFLRIPLKEGRPLVGSAWNSVFIYPFEREAAADIGKHSKRGSADLALFIYIPLKERRPLILVNTLKEGRPPWLCLYIFL